MTDCLIGCITSDDEGRGYYCEECPELRERDASTLVGPDGFTRLDPAVTEAQYNALEMARSADLAERRAEEAELHVEQLRDARDSAERRIERAERLIDSWEHDAPDHSNPVFIGRLRECLQRDSAPVRLRGLGPERAVGGCIHGDCVLLPTRPPTYRCGECGATFDHRPALDEFDRLEDDTRGTEAAG